MTSTPDDSNANDNALPLEELMMMAAMSEDATAAFYDALIEATVFVPGSVTEETEEGPELELHVWQGHDGEDSEEDEFSFIPVFTSTDLLEEITAEDPVPYLSFTMRDLLAAIEDTAIVINPDADISLTLEVDEVDALRDAILDDEDEDGDDDEE